MRAHSSAWLERFPDKEEVDGSSPSGPTQSVILQTPESRDYSPTDARFADIREFSQNVKYPDIGVGKTRIFVNAG
jgi:hypothetical protein